MSEPWRLPPADLVPRSGEVHLWRIRLDVGDDQLDSLRRTLSPDEEFRAAAFRHDRDRRRYIAARGSLRRILGAYLHTAPALVRLAYSAFGKPYVPGGKAAGALTFNLSRSRNRGLVAVTAVRPVGVDIEAIDAGPDPVQLARHFFSVAEQAALARLPERDRRRAFFDCWTAKEAYLKARGTGLSSPLHRFTVAVEPSVPAGLIASDDEPDAPCRWTLATVDAGDGYAAAVTVEGTMHALRQWEAA